MRASHPSDIASNISSDRISTDGTYQTLSKSTGIFPQPQDYIREHQSVWRYNSLQNEYSTIRTLFDKNRASLPKDSNFKIRSLIAPTKGLLEVKHIRLLALAARPVYRSMILFKWMSMLDTARLIMMNNPPYSGEIVCKLRDRKENSIIQVEINSGRKKLLNDPRGAFRFCIGQDAIDALADYFDNHRQGGWRLAEAWESHVALPRT